MTKQPKVTFGETPEAAKPAQAAADTFEVTLSSGIKVVGAKAHGVLKLRIRRLLGDFATDLEMAAIATALLGIRSFAGETPVMRTEDEFNAFLDRFGSDADLNAFVNAYQRFVEPEGMKALDDAMVDGLKRGLTGKMLEAHVAEIMFAHQKKQLQQVRDS